ncbi:MAG: c-type cytochrome [Thermodesulfobacteriota bacterium]
MNPLAPRTIPILILTVAAALLAADAIADTMDGEQLFYGKCGACHAEGGKAPVMAPVKFAAVQWERFFSREKHQRKQDIHQLITPEERSKIQQYLMEHAADSDRPIAAGMK